jgi:hypothetical protein
MGPGPRLAVPGPLTLIRSAGYPPFKPSAGGQPHANASGSGPRSYRAPIVPGPDRTGFRPSHEAAPHAQP